MISLGLSLFTTQPSKLLILFIQKQSRHFWKNMDSIDLNPPNQVRGMIELDRNAFKKIIQIPQLKVPESKFHQIFPLIKKYLLKMERFKPVRSIPPPSSLSLPTSDLMVQNNDFPAVKVILLHPLAVTDWNSLPIELQEIHNLNENSFFYEEIELNYENWRADEILKFVLPKDQESVTSFSRIGHIVHINLRDHLLQYKELIGQVLQDKVSGCKTVVNKAVTIDNTYRNFQMELICGEANFIVKVKENGNFFEFDFSKVYWNPRLSTEHERIVNILNPSDILYDVFAGVGPFSIPAAKKKCIVLANDLNPDSFYWLNKNFKHNKCINVDNITTSNGTYYYQTFNKDGRDFILNDIHDHLLTIWKKNQLNNSYNPKIHITMNLPGMAVEFLNSFIGLFANQRNELKENIHNFPLVHLYSFAKGQNTKEIVQNLVETNLNTKLTNNLDGIYFVRNVSPNKDMYRVSFYLTKEILFNKENLKRHTMSKNSIVDDDDDDDCSNSKKLCS